MTIEEIVKGTPFLVDTTKYHTKENLLKAIDRHLSIVAVKAEIVGDKKFTEAIDVVRKLFPRLGHLSSPKESEWKKASEVVAAYLHRFSEEGKFEEELLRSDIQCAYKEANDLAKKYYKLCDNVRELEKQYRDKYNKPSGAIPEDFYEENAMDED